MAADRKLEDLDYDLELKRVASEIKKQKAKRILVQLPDGLKPFATQIVTELECKTDNKAEFFIWFGTCFGACDVPLEVEKLGVDLIIQFGHSAWKFDDKKN